MFIIQFFKPLHISEGRLAILPDCTVVGHAKGVKKRAYKTKFYLIFILEFFT